MSPKQSACYGIPKPDRLVGRVFPPLSYEQTTTQALGFAYME